MIPRFVQLVLLAGCILLIPSFLYLSTPSSRHQTLLDPSTGLHYSADSILKSQHNANDINPLAQIQQGVGAPPKTPQSWKDWSWNGVNQNVQQGVEKLENGVKGFVDAWRPANHNHEAEGSSFTPLAESSTGTTDHATKPPIGGSASSNTSSPGLERVEGVIMPAMSNATAKVLLGRSTWHFLHLMTLRFPDHPTTVESQTLRTFFETFAQLYPCGECAKHFQQLLKELPPQTGSRKSASLWLCSVHNQVNKSLGKQEFPCDKLDENYDCGCGDDPKTTTQNKGSENITTTTTTTATISNESQHSIEGSSNQIPHKDVTPFG